MSLKKFIQKNNIKQKDLADYLGVGKAQISTLVNGKSAVPRKHIYRLINNNKGWDTSALTEPTSTAEPASSSCHECEGQEGCDSPRLLPAEVVNSPDLDIYEWYQDNCARAEPINVDRLASGSDFAIRVKSDMMYPRIKPNDIIYVQRLDPNERILDNTCYFIDTKEGAFVGFLRVEDEHVLCSGLSGKNVATLHEDEVYGVYRIKSQISSYPVRNDGRAADMNMKSLISRLESSDERTDKLLEELVRAGERVDRALDLVAQMCAKIGNH